MRDRHDSLSQMPDPTASLQPWIQFVQTCGPSWRKKCSRLARQQAIFTQNQAQLALWKERVQDLFAQAGFPARKEARLKDVARDFVCHVCSAAFASGTACAVHLQQMHGIGASVRQYMPFPSLCVGCMKDFHTLQKHRQHLQYRRNNCLPLLESILHPEAPGEHRSLATNKMHQDEYRKPACRVPGPLLPTRAQWRVAAPWKHFPPCPGEQEDHLEKLYLEAWVDWHSATNKDLAEVAPLPLSGLLSSNRCDMVWEAFLAHVEVSMDDDTVALSVDQVLALPHQGQSRQETPGLTMRIASLSSSMPLPQSVPLEGPLYAGEYFVLYLYAGHQRRGDVHAVCRRLAEKYHFKVTVLPLDVIYHHTLCDLLAPASQAFWCRVVASGLCLGILAAPPCETFSVARWRALLAHQCAHGRSRGGEWPIQRGASSKSWWPTS